MKKSIPTFLTIFLTSLVSAGPVEGVGQLLGGLGEVIVIIIQFLSDMMLDIDSFDEFLFAKILLFMIILLVVYTVVKNSSMLGSSQPIRWIVSSAIAILSVRFLPDNFVRAILLQYSTLGVALTIFLPFGIFFLFVHQSGFGPFGRKVGWAIYASSFIAMWAFVYNDIGNASYLYGIGITLILISFLFDKYIHAQFGLSHWRKARADIKDDARVKALTKLKHLEEDYAAKYYTEKQYNEKKRHLEKIVKKAL
jgi:hypothetical protein